MRLHKFARPALRLGLSAPGGAPEGRPTVRWSAPPTSSSLIVSRRGRSGSRTRLREFPVETAISRCLVGLAAAERTFGSPVPPFEGWAGAAKRSAGPAVPRPSAVAPGGWRVGSAKPASPRPVADSNRSPALAGGLRTSRSDRLPAQPGEPVSQPKGTILRSLRSELRRRRGRPWRQYSRSGGGFGETADYGSAARRRALARDSNSSASLSRAEARTSASAKRSSASPSRRIRSGTNLKRET